MLDKLLMTNQKPFQLHTFTISTFSIFSIFSNFPISLNSDGTASSHIAWKSPELCDEVVKRLVQIKMEQLRNEVFLGNHNIVQKLR